MAERLFETILRDKFTEYERYTKENITNILQFSDLVRLFADLDILFRKTYNKSIFYCSLDNSGTHQSIIDHLNLVIDFLTDEDGRINVDNLLRDKFRKNCYRINDIITNMLVGRYIGIGPGELFISFFLLDACVHGSSITSESECETLESMSYDIDTRYYGKFEIKMLDDNNEIRLGGIGTPTNFSINQYIIDLLKNIKVLLEDYDTLLGLYSKGFVKTNKDKYNDIIYDLRFEFNNVSKKGNKHIKNATLYDKYNHGEFSQSDYNKLGRILEKLNNLFSVLEYFAYEKRKDIRLETYFFTDYTYKVSIPQYEYDMSKIIRFNTFEVDSATFEIIETLDNLHELCKNIYSINYIKGSIEEELEYHLEMIPIIAIKNIPIGSDIIPDNCFVGIFTKLPFKRMTANKFKFYVNMGAVNGDK